MGWRRDARKWHSVSGAGGGWRRRDSLWTSRGGSTGGMHTPFGSGTLDQTKQTRTPRNSFTGPPCWPDGSARSVLPFLSVLQTGTPLVSLAGVIVHVSGQQVGGGMGGFELSRCGVGAILEAAAGLAEPSWRVRSAFLQPFRTSNSTQMLPHDARLTRMTMLCGVC